MFYIFICLCSAIKLGPRKTLTAWRLPLFCGRAQRPPGHLGRRDPSLTQGGWLPRRQVAFFFFLQLETQQGWAATGSSPGRQLRREPASAYSRQQGGGRRARTPAGSPTLSSSASQSQSCARRKRRVPRPGLSRTPRPLSLPPSPPQPHTDKHVSGPARPSWGSADRLLIG